MDLNKRSCDCYKWDLTGIPCEHACCCLSTIRIPAEMYVHDYYKKDTFLAAYGHLINPVPGEQFWPEVNANEIQPPKVKVPPG